MGDIRNICRGLTLPQIERMELSDLLRSVVRAHEQRTGTSIDLTLPENDPQLSQSEKICIYRLVQEGLNNAARHAGGTGQRVVAAYSGQHLDVTVADKGPGFEIGQVRDGSLGLAGLRERIESLGGDFAIEISPSGTRLRMRLNVVKGVQT